MIRELAIALALVAQQDPVPLGPGAPSLSGKGERSAPEGMPELNTACAGAMAFGGTQTERAAFCLFEDKKYVGMRTLADQALRENESSFRAHFLMALAQHLGESNLPKSLFHLERAEKLFVDRYGEIPTGAPAEESIVYHRILLERVYVEGEMDRHEEKIRYVDELRRRLGVDYSHLKAWPLLKLKRWDEARAVAEEAVAAAASRGDTYQRDSGLTALCAIESEMRNRDKAYAACKAAAEPYLSRGSSAGGVALTNAGAAAMEMFEFAEAERLYTEATRRENEPTINPWGRLLHVYLRQGRFAEALAAWREMRKYRMARPPYFDQQDQADADLAGASVLIVAGRMQDALRITERAVNVPDRQGTSSADFEQNATGNFVMDRMVRLEVARRLEEEASWSKLWDAVKLRAKAAKMRFEAWSEGRRAAVVLSKPERLLTTLRPECPGSIEVPVWIDAEVISIVGPAAAIAAVEQARKDETLPPEHADPIFDGFLAEAAWLDGDEERALELSEKVIEGLPQSEVLLRARVAAIAAAAAAKLGQAEKSLALWQRVLSADPGAVRRLGLTLPVHLMPASDSPAVLSAMELLEGSPLFDDTGWGFVVQVGEDAVVLATADGSELFRARVPPGKQDDPESLARRIAKTAHVELLVPNVDVTQADIHSLDGGLTGGGRATERAKSIIEEVMGAPPSADEALKKAHEKPGP